MPHHFSIKQPIVHSRITHPFLQTHIETINDSIQPIVDKLTKTTPFLCAALFIKDVEYKKSAGTISTIPTSAITHDRLQFINESIRGRRIDLPLTTLSHTFATHESKLEVSRMNPRDHLTWGVYFKPKPRHDAVLQIAFDRHRSSEVNEASIASLIAPHVKKVFISSKKLIEAAPKNYSLSDELMLDVPVSPNTFAIIWDVIESTKLVTSNYPLFRHYMKRFQIEVIKLADRYGVQISKYTGDGHNMLITIPDHIDRSDLYQVSMFGKQTVLPFLHHLIAIHTSIASQYHIPPRIRIAAGLGHINTIHTGEVTGPVLWEVASLLKSTGGEAKYFTLSPFARHVLEEI